MLRQSRQACSKLDTQPGLLRWHRLLALLDSAAGSAFHLWRLCWVAAEAAPPAAPAAPAGLAG